MSKVSSEHSFVQPGNPDDGITPLQLKMLASQLNLKHESSKFSLDETVDWLQTLSVFNQQALYLEYVSRRVPFFGPFEGKRISPISRRIQ